MPTYRVIRKSDQVEVSHYAAASAIETERWPLDVYDHVELVEDGPQPYTGSWHITKRSFWNRLPAPNEIALRAVINSNSPALLAASLERLKARVDGSPFVDLRLLELVGGVQYLMSDQIPVTVTIDGVPLPLRLTAEEGAAILDTPPTDEELFRG